MQSMYNQFWEVLSPQSWTVECGTHPQGLAQSWGSPRPLHSHLKSTKHLKKRTVEATLYKGPWAVGGRLGGTPRLVSGRETWVRDLFYRKKGGNVQAGPTRLPSPQAGPGCLERPQNWGHYCCVGAVGETIMYEDRVGVFLHVKYAHKGRHTHVHIHIHTHRDPQSDAMNRQLPTL